MTGTEIISLLTQNISNFASAVGPVVGAVFTAIFLRKNTSGKEFEKVKAGLFKEVAEDLLEAGKMTYAEFYKANNFLKVARIADKEYSTNYHDQQNDQYDFDWFVRFYEIVGSISSEKMQELWGKVLAGEINKPHTYSLRTIDTLKNLCQRDAEIFSQICSHCIYSGGRAFLPQYENYLKTCQISLSDLLLLDELGLMNSDSFLFLELPVDVSKALFSNNSLLIVAKESNSQNTLQIEQFPLTTIGAELSALIRQDTSDEDFLLFAREINNNSNVKVRVHHINSVESGRIHYDKTDLLELGV